jgi:hypothetical protein
VALVSNNPTYELLQAGKVAVILLVILPLLTTGPAVASAALRGAEIAMYINVLLTLAGALAGIGLGGLMAPGRFGSFLNTPGSLWRVGILLFAGSGLRFFWGIGGLRDSLRLTASALLLVLDGSRTGYVLILAAGVTLPLVVFRSARREAPRGRPFGTRLKLAVVASVVLVVSATTVLFFGTREVDLVQRNREVLEALRTGDAGAIQDLDPWRVEMLRDAIAAIQDHVLLGTGMGTTKTSSSIASAVVHIAYLQIWADVGLVGFLSFVALTIGSIPVLWKQYKARATTEPGRRALFYNGIFLLVCWAVAGLLHAVSTEISEWVMFVLGYSFVVASGEPTALSCPAATPLQVLPLEWPRPKRDTVQSKSPRHSPLGRIRGMDVKDTITR